VIPPILIVSCRACCHSPTPVVQPAAAVAQPQYTTQVICPSPAVVPNAKPEKPDKDDKSPDDNVRHSCEPNTLCSKAMPPQEFPWKSLTPICSALVLAPAFSLGCAAWSLSCPWIFPE
jgi:hypothetical protein